MTTGLYKKGMVLGIIALFLGAGVVLSVGREVEEIQETEINDFIDIISNPPPDELDQYQSALDNISFFKGWTMSQSFKPTLNTLTRVKLWLQNEYNAQDTLTVSIKSDLYGNNITYKTIPADTILYGGDWYEFDFPDIRVNLEETYYIVFYDNDLWIPPSVIGWAGENHNNYSRGSIWLFEVLNNEWVEYYPDQWDFTFKTYGYNNQPPSKPTCRYIRKENELSVSSNDVERDKIRYGISWDNNQVVEYWTDYFNSSLEVRIDCANYKGTVGVIAEDEYGDQSEWVSVTSKSKPYMIGILQRFLDNHQHMFSLLQLLGLYY